jgi:hypothetical protein
MHARLTPLIAALLVLNLGPARPLYAQRSEQSLEHLVKLYKELGLPLPPRNAPLVRYRSSGGYVLDGVQQPEVFSLAFLITAKGDREEPLIQHGLVPRRLAFHDYPKQVAPTKQAIVGTAPNRDDLILAILFSLRGWNELACATYERLENENQVDFLNELQDLAWGYWDDELFRLGSDRAEIARQMKKALAIRPVRPDDFRLKVHNSLMRSLAPSKAAPGSVEALVDGLVEFDGTIGRSRWYASRPGGDECYTRIVRLAFDAVPALIAHLDDERLMRGEKETFNNLRSSRYLFIKDAVRSILEGLSGEDLEIGAFVGGENIAIAKAKATVWWNKAQKQTEERYLIGHFFDDDEDSSSNVRRHRILVLQAKYPARIPQFYEGCLRRHPQCESDDLCNAIVQLPITANAKFALLEKGLNHADCRHKLAAIVAFKKLDPKRFEDAMLHVLQNFPRDTNEMYSGASASRIARLALSCNDPRIWPALRRAAQSASVGLKLEILGQLTTGSTAEAREQRIEVIRLLNAFLEDSTLRDITKDGRLQGPVCKSMYEKIEVRNAVALLMATLLKLETPTRLTDLTRSDEEWAQFRKQMRDACAVALAKSAK